MRLPGAPGRALLQILQTGESSVDAENDKRSGQSSFDVIDIEHICT